VIGVAMDTRHFLTSIGILLAFVLTACLGEKQSKVDETLNNPQAVKVTQPVTQTI